ncbi:hypothetical protein [uncultured Acinetobacter sp.]|uniref:hypothetical protein n=1 Tax=uncultured Acinetobacter sp. TaxID=165433 RepID=UPI0025F2C204|nr:hypothetical protein [uncultured Acinetobacter sp.]
MHSPRPYGLLVVNGKLTENDSLFIDHQLKKLSNQKAISTLESIRQVKDLPDGGYVILQDMGGMLKAIAHKELILNKFEPDGLAKLYIPMLYSGVVTRAKVRKTEGVGIKLTEQCRRRLINYLDEELPSKTLYLQRFVIPPNENIVPEFIDFLDNSDLVKTQYDQQKPTWYSGALAEIMQIVGGYGKQTLNDLPNNPLERMQFNIPNTYIERIVDELDGVRLPGYSGIPPLDGSFQYDYKFYNTNGVTFDSGKKPWLIQVNKKGVWAMPLPIIPATATQAFREYIDFVGDQEIINILDRFGALPSGESFPINDHDFHAWKRAGVIIKVCDSSDFYTHTSYSDACGWSFNSSGIEGFNTCFGKNDDGILVGNAYKMRLEFSLLENWGWRSKVDVEQQYLSVNSKYLNRLFQLLVPNTVRTNAILYKLRRVPQADIYQLALTSINNPLGVTSVDVDYWDNYQLDPISRLNGRIVKVGTGNLYHDADITVQPQIKFPSVKQKGCISFNFNPSNTIPKIKPNCDTIMFGYYIGDSLKVIKYFVDWRSFKKQVSGNFEEVMIVGSWEQSETVGNSSPQGYFYTTDLDLREVFSPYEMTTKILGLDKGFDTKPYFSFLFFGSMNGDVWRNRYYTHKINTLTSQNNTILLGVCIPFYCRNSALVAMKKIIVAETERETLDLLFIRDPNSYKYWTYDSVWAWVGPVHKKTGQPYPQKGNPVWVETAIYEPMEYSDFADQGSWLPDLPYDITWLVHPDSNQWNYSGGGTPPKIQEYSKEKNNGGKTSGALYVSINKQVNTVFNSVPTNGYFTPSPSLSGSVFYRDACKVVFGDSEYANISETNENNLRYKWGNSSLVEHKTAYHFIGVINE